VRGPRPAQAIGDRGHSLRLPGCVWEGGREFLSTGTNNAECGMRNRGRTTKAQRREAKWVLKTSSKKVSANDNVIFPVDTLIAKGISEPRDYGSETAHSVPWRHLRRDEVHY
jgi:hypothetical protein